MVLPAHRAVLQAVLPAVLPEALADLRGLRDLRDPQVLAARLGTQAAPRTLAQRSPRLRRRDLQTLRHPRDLLALLAIPRLRGLLEPLVTDRRTHPACNEGQSKKSGKDGHVTDMNLIATPVEHVRSSLKESVYTCLFRSSCSIVPSRGKDY